MRYFIHWLPTAGTGNIELHQNGCIRFPDPTAVECIGEYDCAHDALAAARDRFGDVHGCSMCCPECHHPQSSRRPRR